MEGPQPWAFVDSGFVKWFMNYDETKLRPFLIRNYNTEKAILQDQLYDLQEKNLGGGDDDDLLEMADRVTKLEERRRTVALDDKQRSLSALGFNSDATQRLNADNRRYHGDTGRFGPGASATLAATSKNDLMAQVKNVIDESVNDAGTSTDERDVRPTTT